MAGAIGPLALAQQLRQGAGGQGQGIAGREGGIAIGPASRIVCVGAAAGRAVLEAEDDFLTRLGPFDRAVRLASAEPVSPEVAPTTITRAPRFVSTWSNRRPTICSA
jgi:hypothetical protein